MIVTTNKVKGASLFDISSCIYFYFRQSGNDPNNLDLINNNAVMGFYESMIECYEVGHEYTEYFR